MRHHIRFTESAWASLLSDLLRRLDVETAAVLIGRSLPTGGGWITVVEDVVLLADDGYELRRADQIRIDPVALNRIVRQARERERSVITVHTHPMSDQPWFSRADDLCDARLMPSFAVQVPDVPHGSIVVAASGIAEGRLFLDDGPSAAAISVVGQRLLHVTLPRDTAPVGWFSRQELALGAAGQQALRALRVGVVGLGGTGSVVVAQLAHLGFIELVLFDGDIVEASNVSRILAATVTDAGVTPKVEVARRYVASTGLPVRVDAYAQPVSGDEQIRVLRSCDVVFSCVDRHTPRALLNRLAYEALVPVIDMGCGFRVDRGGTISGCAGRVVVLGPGRPCLACWGDLDPEALRREALDDEARASELAEGYISGADVPQPSVIPFNTLLAGAAVIELLRVATGFAGGDDPPQRLAFAFATGVVRRNTLAGSAGCSVCGRVT